MGGPTVIEIGYITSDTGIFSPSFSDGCAAAQARAEVQNVAGGVDGREIKIVAVDDKSSAPGNLAAAQRLIAAGVFGVVDFSAYAFGGYKALQAAGIPVTGGGFDGPEWGVEPNSNMFSFLPPQSTAWNGRSYYYNVTDEFLAAIGSNKPAGFADANSPSSTASIEAIYAGGTQSGLPDCHTNYSVPSDGAHFAADVSSLKAAGCDSVVASLGDSSDRALATAIDRAELSKVKKLFYSGYDTQTVSTASTRAAFEGSYFETPVIWDTKSPPVREMLANLAKYDLSLNSDDLPDFATWGSYIAMDLMVSGVQLAGTNPTRQEFISNLRRVTSYDAGGVLPSPTTFANFGIPQMLAATGCTNFVQLVHGQFVNADPNGQPVCAGLISVPAG
jgi:branched-chain amino acid transport system substrate-binding protein